VSTSIESTKEQQPPTGGNGTVLEVNDAAVARIKKLLEKEGQPDRKFRVAVDGGGCSGFQYRFDFDFEQNEDDLVIEKDGVTVLVDSMSIPFLQGSVLNYIETLGESRFTIENPNSTANCGCGNSFSV
jgi:iron-sulfur cluster insertion protein